MAKSLTHSMRGYLPNSITEMWKPSQDFAFFPTPDELREECCGAFWAGLFLLSFGGVFFRGGVSVVTPFISPSPFIVF